MSVFAWTPPGPVSDAFMRDRSPFAAMMGPIGGGKTTTVLTKLSVLAAEQAPDPDGVRRTKWLILRDTFRNLARTVIPSWHKRFPPTIGAWTGGGDAPARHLLTFRLADGTLFEMDVLFAALGEAADIETFARGFEVTGVYLNELDTLPSRELVTHLRGRIGRYPRTDPDAGFPGPTWRGILADFNAPDLSSPVYVDWVEGAEANGYRLFRQPGGRSPDAENLAHLPAGYYDAQVAGAEAWWIRRMVDNVPAFSRRMGGIYGEYDDGRHAAREPIKALDAPIVLGADQGLRGACVVLQRSPFGQWRALAELPAPDEGWGATRFGEELRAFLDREFHSLPVRDAGCDPAGWQRDSDERTWAQVVGRVAGVRFRPAPTNAVSSRHETVRQALRRSLEAGAPGLVISPRCTLLRRGFLGAYRWKTVKVDGREQPSDQVVKDRVADVHDALQYGLMVAGEYAAVKRGEDARRRRDLRRAGGDGSSRAYHPFSW